MQIIKNQITNKDLRLKYPLNTDIIKNILVSASDYNVSENMIHYNKDKNTYFTIIDLIDPQDLLLNNDKYTYKYSKDFKNIFLKYKKYFPVILEDDIVFAALYLLQTVTGVENKDIKHEQTIKKTCFDKIKKEMDEYRVIYEDDNYIFPKKDGYVKYYMNLANVNINITNLDKPLDIYRIIKEIKLSKDIPFIATMKEKSDIPIVKVDKSIPREVLAEWSIINKKPKIFKGLTFKVLNNIGEYRNVNVSRTFPKIFIKFSYNDNDKITLDDTFSETLYISNKLINNISKIFGEKYILSHVNLVSFSIKVNFNYQINIEKLREFLYKNSNVKMNGDSYDIIRFEFNDLLYIIQADVMTVFSLKTKEHVNKAINNIYLLVPFSSFKENISKNKKEIVKNKIDSIDCQKSRRPELTTNIDKNSIFYKNNYYTCFNNKHGYPYVGFTVKGNPCCFKKQKKNTLENDYNIKTDLIKMFSGRILTTIKILQKDKIGEFKFLKNAYRIYNPSGLIQYCILWLLNSNKTLDKTIITNELFRTINNGDVYDKYDINTYRDNYENNKINQADLVDIFEKLYKIHIIIYEIEIKRGNDKWKITKGNNTQYSKSIYISKIILKNKIHYEPVVFTVDKINIEKYKGNNSITPIYTPPYKIEISDIKCQIVNGINRVEYIVTNMGIFPVYPIPPLYGIKMIFEEPKPFINLKKQLEICKDLKISVYYQIIKEGKTIGLLAGCNKVNGIIPVIPSDRNKNIPISPMFFNGLLMSNYLINSYEDRHINPVIYKKELFLRFKMLIDSIISKKIIDDILKSSDTYYNKWKKIQFYFSDIKQFITFTENIDISKYYIPPERNICSKITINDPFCMNDNLIMTKDTYTLFMDKLITIILNNNINLKVPKNLNRFQGFTLRNNEMILTTNKDFEYLMKK
jgi:hypothetical protein